MSDKFLNDVGLETLREWILEKLGLKQDRLISETNIKTVNGKSLLGSGNIDIGKTGITISMTATDGSVSTINVAKVEV